MGTAPGKAAPAAGDPRPAAAHARLPAATVGRPRGRPRPARARGVLAGAVRRHRPPMARIAMIADDMFEDSELRELLYHRLREAGHEVVPARSGSRAGKQITGKKGHEKVTIQRARRSDVRADDFDALVIPGGYSPDKPPGRACRWSRSRGPFFDQGKLVAAVCHAPWMLIEADVTEDRTLTSWPSIRTDLLNAGARWVDREVVEASATSSPRGSPTTCPRSARPSCGGSASGLRTYSRGRRVRPPRTPRRRRRDPRWAWRRGCPRPTIGTWHPRP